MTTEIKPDWQPNPWKGKRVLQLGCGRRPMEGAVNHDRRRHGPWVDAAWDLDRMPWPLRDMVAADELGPAIVGGDRFDVICLYDVVEHVVDVIGLVNECAEMLLPGGLLVMRGGAASNPASYADVTHRHWFTEDSMNIFDRRTAVGEHYSVFYEDSLGRPPAQFHLTEVIRCNPDPRYGIGDIQWSMTRL